MANSRKKTPAARNTSPTLAKPWKKGTGNQRMSPKKSNLMESVAAQYIGILPAIRSAAPWAESRLRAD